MCLFVGLAVGAMAGTGPFDGKQFRGRIAYSADGNFNDPDDWAASPMVLAIFHAAGVKDRLVHFSYNSIVPRTDPAWELIHGNIIKQAAAVFGYDPSIFIDCRKDRERAVAALIRSVDQSSEADPLYLIVAGPMDIPCFALRQSAPEKRRFVYCISHSAWNDGYADSESGKGCLTVSKRQVIETGVNWVQIADQNPRLRTNRYWQFAREAEWAPFFWLRDSQKSSNQFLWYCLQISHAPDVSDAGMAYFLVTGDERADPEKLRHLLDDGVLPPVVGERNTIRLEAEAFHVVRDGAVLFERRGELSHNLGVESIPGKSRFYLATRFDQPYAAVRDRYDVLVRGYTREASPQTWVLEVRRSEKPLRRAFQVADQKWANHLLSGFEIGIGDQIALEIAGQGGVDFIQLQRRTGESSPPATSPPRLVATGPLDNPAVPPGQVIVVGSNPGYLKYNGGGPVFLCGPDNPEEFLYLGSINPDGTRSGGGQEQLIAAMAKGQVTAFHCQMFRMRRCNIKDEGDDTHCPFVDFDPAKPLNPAILDQWDKWLEAMEKHGIVVHLEFYNDATDVEKMGWTLDAQGNLHPDEHKFISGIVQRFKHRKNIIWGIAESINKLPRARVPHFMKISQLIAELDPHRPIVHSFVTPETTERDLHPDNVTPADYEGDPRIRLITWLHVLSRGNDYGAQRAEFLKYAFGHRERFILMKNETEMHPRTQPASRIYLWCCALAGLHTLEALHDVRRVPQLLPDHGRLARFMEQTDFYRMQPKDDLAAGSGKWVLAFEGQSYIVYTYDYTGRMGIKSLPVGEYDLLWFDPVSGEQVSQTSTVTTSGEKLWEKPGNFGREVALYIKRR